MPCTAPVVTAKVIVLDPAGMVALDGTCAAVVFELLSDTTAPAGGAAPFNVSVPVEVPPAVTVPGLNVSEERAATVTVRVLDLVVP